MEERKRAEGLKEEEGLAPSLLPDSRLLPLLLRSPLRSRRLRRLVLLARSFLRRKAPQRSRTHPVREGEAAGTPAVAAAVAVAAGSAVAVVGKVGWAAEAAERRVEAVAMEEGAAGQECQGEETKKEEEAGRKEEEVAEVEEVAESEAEAQASRCRVEEVGQVLLRDEAELLA